MIQCFHSVTYLLGIREEELQATQKSQLSVDGARAEVPPSV